MNIGLKLRFTHVSVLLRALSFLYLQSPLTRRFKIERKSDLKRGYEQKIVMYSSCELITQ